MEIKPETDLAKNPSAWTEEWHQKRNAAVSQLVADGMARQIWTRKGDLSREDHDDEQMRWFFWRQDKCDRTASDRAASPAAYLYEGVTSCMKAAREDERKRIAKTISSALKVLLGDEFSSLLYDIADVNDIHIGD